MENEAFIIERIFMYLVLEKLEEQGMTKLDLSIKAFAGDRNKPDDKIQKLSKNPKPQRVLLQDVHNIAKAFGQSVPGLMLEVYEARRTGKYKDKLSSDYDIKNPAQKKFA